MTINPLRSRPSKGAQTRARLIKAAREVFARDHYQNARIADICLQADKSVGVFYRYFSDKQEIFLACAEQLYEELLKTSPKSTDFEGNLLKSTQVSLEIYWHTIKDYYGIIAGMFEIGMTNPNIAQVWRDMRSHGIKRFAYRISEQQKLGKCNGLDPVLVSSALMNMLEFSFYNWNAARLDFPTVVISDEQAIEGLFHIVRNTLEL